MEEAGTLLTAHHSIFNHFMLKNHFGKKSASTNIELEQVEVDMKCSSLNKMASGGMPMNIKSEQLKTIYATKPLIYR